VLTEVKAYSSWASAPTLLLDQDGRPETDLVQIRNIEGLEPVKASVNTSLFGSVDGAAYTGSSVPSRNIVLTIHPNPDWHTWKYEDLRKLIYSYFMTKKPVRLVFYNDEDSPVEIFGIVESVDNSIFSKDQEFNVSVICPDPYFTSLDPKVITGQSIRSGGAPRVVTYNGSVETGIRVKVSFSSGTAPTTIGIQVGDPKSKLLQCDSYRRFYSLSRHELGSNAEVHSKCEYWEWCNHESSLQDARRVEMASFRARG
jgi:hypothetical protein